MEIQGHPLGVSSVARFSAPMEAVGIVNNSSFRLIVALISALLSAQWLMPVAFAEGTFAERREARQAQAQFANNVSAFRQAAGRHMDLDLASTAASVAVTSAMLGGQQQAVITRDGMNRQVMAGDMLTASEFVALAQIMAGKSQTLELGSLGEAVGGTFSVSDLNTSRFSSLVVPQGVVAVVNTASGLHVSNTLSAEGSVVAQGGGTLNLVNIRAGNLLVNGNLATPTESKTDLNIFSASDISNFGNISASGTLSLFAVGNIFNGASNATISGGEGVLLYSNAGQITNAGLIGAQNGNVSFDTSLTQNFLLNNSGGVVQAAQGDINVRNAGFLAKNTTAISGGKFSANELNISGGNGMVKVFADEVSGLVNINGGEAHVQVSGGTLKMGAFNLTGDPTIVNSDGDVEILGNLIFPGQDLAILAQGDVYAYPNVTLIDLSSKSANSGNLHIIAGYDISPVTGGQTTDETPTLYQVLEPSDSGGSVYMDYVQVKTSSTGTFGSGNVTIYAHSGDTGAGDISIAGITTSSAKNNSGSVVVYGDGDRITIAGGIDTHGYQSGGSVDVAGAAVAIDQALEFSNGTFMGGEISTAPSTSTQIRIGDQIIMNGNINTTSAIAAGDVRLTGPDVVLVFGGIDASSPNAPGKVEIESADGLSIEKGITTASANGQGNDIVIAAKSGLVIRGNVTTSGKLDAGNVNIVAEEGAISIGVNDPLESPLIYETTGGIFANSTTGNGGAVSLMAKAVVVGKGINANGMKAGGSIDVGAESSAYVFGVTTSTASTYVEAGQKLNGVGGNVNVTSAEDTVKLGSVKTSAPGGGGAVTISAQNIDIDSSITTDAKNTTDDGVSAGSVSIEAQEDVSVGGAISAQGPNGGDVLLTALFGDLIVKGTINTNGGLLDAGSVTMKSGLGITTTGDILTKGQHRGGNVDIGAGASLISIGGSINTSGLKQAGTRDPGKAGSIKIGVVQSVMDKGAFGVLVKGSLIAQGGAGSTVSGNTGGDVQIHTKELSSLTHERIGSIDIGGYIATQGGAGGGNGGNVELKSGTVQVRGAASGASVNTLGGKGTAPGESGTIVIETSQIQPLPVVFDLASSTTSEYALPGALFEIGVPTVNGTAGSLVAGGASDTITTSRVIGSRTQGKVSVKTSDEVLGDISAEILQDSVVKTINLLVDPLNPNSARTKVTPSQALALYQVTRGNAQTIGLTSAGAASNQTADLSEENHIDITGAEFIRPMTAFNISTAVVGHEHEITVNVVLQEGTPSSRLLIAPSLKSAAIKGNLTFTGFDDPTIQNSQIDLGAAALTIGANGSLVSDAYQTLRIRSTTNLTITNNGEINSFDLSIELDNSKGTFNLLLGPSSQIVGAGDDGGTLDLQARGGTFNLQNVNNMQPGTFIDTTVDILANKVTIGSSKIQNGVLDISGPRFLGESTLEVGSGNTVVNIDSSVDVRGALAGVQGLTFNVDGSVNFTNVFVASDKSAAITATQNIVLNDGNIFHTGQNLTMTAGTSTSPGSIEDTNADGNLFSVEGNLTINGRTAVLLAGETEKIYVSGNLAIVSAGEVALGGTLRTGDPTTLSSSIYMATAPLVKSASIKKAGSITVTGSAVSVEDATSMTTYGGSIKIVALDGNIAIGDFGSFEMNGGSLSILASNNVTIGSENYVFANGSDKGGNGGIEIVAGSTVSNIVNLLKARTFPPAINANGATVQTYFSLIGTIDVDASVTFAPTADATDLNIFDGVIKIQNLGHTLEIDSSHFYSASKIAYSSRGTDDTEELIVDTGDEDGATEELSL